MIFVGIVCVKHELFKKYTDVRDRNVVSFGVFSDLLILECLAHCAMQQQCQAVEVYTGSNTCHLLKFSSLNFEAAQQYNLYIKTGKILQFWSSIITPIDGLLDLGFSSIYSSKCQKCNILEVCVGVLD